MSPKIPPFDQEEMDEFKVFKTFKERGEWVEALFMAASLRHGYKVLKPWGRLRTLRPRPLLRQPHRKSPGKIHILPRRHRILRQFKPNYFSDPYTLAQLDFFAAYVIMQNAWYLIPAKILLGGKPGNKA